MKLFYFLKLSAVALLLFFVASCCNKGGDAQPSTTIYNYTTPVVNPPDNFQINYTVSVVGDKAAVVSFETNSVWVVEKLGDSRVLYSVSNGLDKVSITKIDTIGFEGGKPYGFIANNYLGLDLTNYLVGFSKTSLDYDSFGNKF